jgi:hypothetical protein
MAITSFPFRVHFFAANNTMAPASPSCSLQRLSRESQQSDPSLRHPSNFLNVFEVFSPTLSHSMPPDFPTKSGTMPHLA